jgi:hypothetical protein
MAFSIHSIAAIQQQTEELKMTAIIHQLHAELSIHPVQAMGNPDIVTILPDFPSPAEAAEWIQVLRTELTTEQGSFSAQALTRLTARNAHRIETDEFDGRSMLLRSVATVRRPSGRVTGIALAHMAVHAEREVHPEGVFISLRFGAPVMHLNDSANKTEVLEATLIHMLDQAEEAASSLVLALGHSTDMPIVWTLPTRSSGAHLLQELNARLVQRFYGAYYPGEGLALAA